MCDHPNQGSNDAITKFEEQHLVSKYRKLKENLLKPFKLTSASVHIYFGSKIMLKAPYVPAGLPDKTVEKGMHLCALIKIDEIHHMQDVKEGSCISASADGKPCARNTFTIINADGSDGGFIKYGQDFHMEIACSSERKKKLYLKYDPDPVPWATDLPVNLSSSKMNNTRWRILSLKNEPLTRFEMEGTHVWECPVTVKNHLNPQKTEMSSNIWLIKMQQ